MFVLTTGNDIYPQIVNLNLATGVFIHKRTFGMVEDKLEFIVKAEYPDDNVTLSVHKTLEEAEAEIHRLYELLKGEKQCNS